MIKSIEQGWILAGYAIFAKEGPAGLKVERVAREVGKSKSSFYHLFADTEIFTEKLLAYHLERAREVAAKSAEAKNLVPELLELLFEIKQDLLFNKQLRIYRDNPDFRKCFEQANARVEETFIVKWAESLGLAHHPDLARKILNMTVDNFYLRITEENMSYEWLLSFLNEIRILVKDIIRTTANSNHIK